LEIEKIGLSACSLKGQSFQFPKTSVVITTDASKKGKDGLGPVEYGYSKQYSIESGTYCGEIEYFSRSAQLDKNTTNRMVFE
jgi:hypothetical protein